MAEALFTPLCVRMLEGGHAVRFRAPGSSMHPAIRDGEWLTVEPVEPVALRRGNVLLYRSRRGLTAHRVRTLVAPDGAPLHLVLRGDNAGGCDEHVEPADILGRVACVERGGRRIDPGSIGSRAAARIRRTLGGLRRTLGTFFLEATTILHNGLRRRSVARQGGLS